MDRSRRMLAGLVATVALVVTACSSERTAEPQAANSIASSTATASTPANVDSWDGLTNCPHFAFTLDDAERMSVLSAASEQGLIQEVDDDLMAAIRDACLSDDSRPISEVVGDVIGSTSTTSSGGDGNEQAIWDICYAPIGSVAQINSNPALVDEVLADFPDQWKQHVPVPEGDVRGVCHQHTVPEGGVGDVWWLNFKDVQDGTDSAFAWDQQLVAVGAQRFCQPDFPLENLSEEKYTSCSYDVPGGYTAHISNSQGPVQLSLQPDP